MPGPTFLDRRQIRESAQSGIKGPFSGLRGSVAFPYPYLEAQFNWQDASKGIFFQPGADQLMQETQRVIAAYVDNRCQPSFSCLPV